MGVEFNPKALDIFRNAQFNNENTIANLDGDGLKSGGIYKKDIRVFFRSKDEKRANNEVRTALLRSLGEAFNISGMKKDGDKVSFSREFMAQLEKILGSDVLKSGDFGINGSGKVASGKPLTQRRINAILTKAALVGKSEYNYETYKVKMAAVKAKITALDLEPTKIYLRDRALQHFDAVEKLMTFMEEDLDTLIETNFEYDSSDKDSDNDKNVPFVMNNRIKGSYSQKPLTSIAMVTNYVQEKTGQLFHIQENILGNGKIARMDDLTEPDTQITDYLRRAMQAFVTTSLDLYFESEQSDDLEGYLTELGSAAPCIEGKTTALTEFMLSKAATHNSDQNLDQCIGREIAAIVKNNPSMEEWKDMAPIIKKNLVGVTRPITVPVKTTIVTKDNETLENTTFKPLLDKNNKPVVRPVTEEDIDRLGQACLDAIYEM